MSEKQEDKRSFWHKAKMFFERKGWRIISADELEHLKYEEEQGRKDLHELVELQHKVRFLENEFLKRHKPSEMLGVIFEKDACPYYSTNVVMAANPTLPRGTCMKYGSYGHIELALPWGMPLCTLKDADTCPIFNHAVPYTYGIKNGEKPYMSRWWLNIRGEEEGVTDWQKEVFERIWCWLKENGKVKT